MAYPIPHWTCFRWIFAVLVVVVIATTAFAQEEEAESGPAPEDPRAQWQAAIEAGNKYIEEGKFEEAVASFSLVISQTKNNILAGSFQIVAQAGRARALFELKEYDAAIADYKQVLNLNPDEMTALIGRGKAYLEQQYADAALPDFEKAFEQDRSNPEVLFGLGKSYIMLGGWQQGLKPLKKYVELNQENAEAYTLLAQAQTGVGKNDEALASIAKSVELNPDDHQTYFVAGTVYLRKEDYPNAVGAFAEAIKHYVPPEDSEAPYVQGYLALVASLNELGDGAPDAETKISAYRQAIGACDALLQLIGPPPGNGQVRGAALYSRGVAQRMLFEYGDAIESFSEAITANPELADAYFRRGICYHYINEDRMAIADFEQAALLGFDDPSRARLWEGFTYAKIGNYHEAVRAYGQSIAGSDRFVPAYVNRGLAYMSQGEYDKAVRDFNDAIRMEPTNSDHYFKRGVAYGLAAEHQKAADSFAAAITFNKAYEPAYRHLAQSLDQLGKPELAQEYRKQGEALKSAAN